MKSASSKALPAAAPDRPEGVAWPVLVMVGLTVVAALLRFPFLSRWGLWLDEIYVRENALEPLTANLKTVHFVHFLAVKAGLALGDSPFGLRIASACFGVAAVPLGFVTARRALGFHVAALFAFFLAVVPYCINYSVDANYYSHMIFWSLLGLYAAVRTEEGGSAAWLVLLLPISLVAFFVHPFSAIFFASTGFIGAIGAALRWRFSRPGGAEPAATSRSGLTAAVFGLGIVTAVGMVWALGSTSSGRELIRVAGRFTEMIEIGESPKNVTFSWDFFENFFRRIGPAYYVLEGRSPALSGFIQAGSLICFLGFLGGLWRLRGRPILIALLVLPFLLSFGVLFNLRAERYFNIRYFSYLVPLYWLGIAMGAEGAGNFLGRRLPQPLARAIPFIVASVLFAPQFQHLLFTDGRNWDAVMPVMAKRARIGEPIVYTNWAEEALLPYYQERYGLEDHSILRLAYTENRSKLSEAELKALCYRTPSLWFVSSWLEIQSSETVTWATSHLETVARGESIFSDRYDVTAFYWDWGGRYVLPPRILNYRPEAGDFQEGGFSQDFLFEEGRTYRLTVTVAPSAASPPVIQVDGVGAEAASLEGVPGAGTQWMVEVPIAAGEHRIQIKGMDRDGLVALEIAPLYPDGALQISAATPSAFYPSDYVWAPLEQETYWLCLKRNTFASYDFGILNGGLQELTCEGRNDKPGPVWIEFRIDGDTQGVVQFEDNDNELGTRSFPVNLDAGPHVLTVRFLNEGLVNEAPEDADRDAWIRAFTLRPLAESETVKDDRIFTPGGDAVRIPLAEPGTLDLAPGWSLVADGDTAPTLVPAELPGEVAWSATLPRECAGLLLRSPIQPLPQSGMVYVSALLKAEGLLNHSINLRIVYLNEAKTPVAEKIVNQEGIYRTTDWVRFVDFQPVPETVRYVQAAFWAYPNGRQPSAKPGRVYFGDFRLEAAPTSGAAPGTRPGAKASNP